MTTLPCELTEDEFHDELELTWAILHAMKWRYVKATSQDEKEHYLQAIDWAEKEHRCLWEQFVNGDYRWVKK